MKRLLWPAVLILTLGAAPPTTAPAADDLPLNAAVLTYAAAQVGHSVGDGECTALAIAALRSAGARRNHGYSWGQKLDPGEPVRPGDVMQFESCVFAGHDARHWWRVTLGSPHHTAIVKAVLPGRRAQLYTQNPGPVVALTVNFAELQSGTYVTFRPAPAD